MSEGGGPTSSKSRSLNLSQTLDELLGMGKKDDRHSLNSPARPPTRHGRDSASSTEENKDPSPNSHSGTSTESWRMDDELGKERVKHAGDDDEFLNKLNEMRRRSLVSSEEPVDRRISIDLDKNSRLRNRKPSEIVEESEEDSNNNSRGRETLRAELNTLSISRPSTGSSTQTFLIGQSAKAPPRKATPPVPAKRRSQSEEKTIRASTSLRPVTGSPQHEQWLRRKMEDEKQRKREEREKKEQKEKLEAEKRKNAEKLFERWKQDHDERAREQKRVKREKERKKREAEEEAKKAKRKDAEKTFLAWKQDHEQTLISHQKRLKELEEQRKMLKEQEKDTKSGEARAAFEAWNRAKREAEEKNKRALEEKRRREKEEEENERDYKLMLADQAYETWLHIKESERELASSLGSNSSRTLPWVPPSNTVPRQFVSSGKNRRRSLDRRGGRVTSANATRLPRATSAKSLYSLK